ncbi:MAG: manganese efflux pump [Lachnospiraceae bacterium]|nr:manganese efflux pump [Lachnospiraceae bacterium]
MLGNFLLAVSLSLDALMVGATYRIRGIRVRAGAGFLIGGVCCLMTLVAILLGTSLGEFLSPQYVRYIGAGIIIVMGIRVFFSSTNEKSVTAYDRDASLTIDKREALVVGAALSADSISAGIAIAMLGGNVWTLPFIVGGVTICFLWLGQTLPIRNRKSTRLAGILLLLIGISRLVLS